MRIKIVKKHGQEVELGDRGDVVLVRTNHRGKESYLFGKLHSVVRLKPKKGSQDYRDSIRFSGVSYLLNSTHEGETEVPRISLYRGFGLNSNSVEYSVNGLENIFNHLESAGNSVSNAHADLLRRMSHAPHSPRRKR